MDFAPQGLFTGISPIDRLGIYEVCISERIKIYNVVNCIFYDVTLGWSKGSGGLLYQSKLK